MVNKTPITGRVYVPDVLPFLSPINSPSPSMPIKIYPPVEIKEHFYHEDILLTPEKPRNYQVIKQGDSGEEDLKGIINIFVAK
jgi:hypothetical protein